jgi:hypothetical protein
MTSCRTTVSIHRSVALAPSTPVCSLTHDGERLIISVDQAGRPRCRRRLVGVDLDHLQHLIRSHRASFAKGWDPSPYDLWVSATEELLADTYDLISQHLVEMLGQLPRVALDLDGGTLPLLPIETAHRPGLPALFEITQVFRSPKTGRTGSSWLSKRCFRLDVWQGDASDLDAVALEHILVSAAHARANRTDGRVRHTERLVHLAGHNPSIPPGAFTANEHAHVVLSGCESLPRTLPEGVASALGSLWPVDDHTNATIMAAYHTRLASGVGPLEALRQAQLLHRSMPPAAWASYVHIGNPN